MSPRRDPDHDLERLLDEDGGEFAAIYRRLSRPEPPRRLDRVVLAHAARAVHGGRAPLAQRWMLGLGSAAGLVLAAGIAWQVGKQLESRDAQPDGSSGRNRPSVIAVQPIDRTEAPQKAESDVMVRDEVGPAASAPAPEQEAVEPLLRKAAPPPKPAAPPMPAVAPAMKESVAEPKRANALSADAEVEAAPFPPAEDQPNTEPAPGAAGDLRKRDSREQAAGAATAGMTRSQSAPAPLQSRAPAPTSSVQLRQNMHLPPEEWLAEIVRLKREGHSQQAIENLRLFRRMHPDWKLSDELLRLAQ